MESRRDRDKKGTGHQNLTKSGEAPDYVPAARQTWETFQTACLKVGFDANRWLTDTASLEVQRLPSPGPRQDFDRLCADGCHPRVLGALLLLTRRSPDADHAWARFTGPSRRRETAARKLDEAANAIENTFDGNDERGHQLIADAFVAAGRRTPPQIVVELRELALLIRLGQLLSKGTKARALSQVMLYVLCSYVQRATGSPRDLNLSGLLANVRSQSEYNETALRQWRYRNMAKLESGTLADWKIADFLVALGTVLDTDP